MAEAVSAPKRAWISSFFGITLPTAGQSPDDPGAAFTARLKGLLPRIQAATDPEPRLLASQAGGAARQHDYAAGNALLDRIETLLGGGTSVASLAAARDAWQQASDAVDTQIGALQSALRASDDEELREISEFGFNGITGNFKVPLMAALQSATGNPPAPDAVGKLKAIVTQFRAHIETDERVEACDANPFGVSVSIRSTLGAALAQMEQALAA